MATHSPQLKFQIDPIVWRCPSNIAIVKYWGKKPGQIPCNSSISMTLSKLFTETELQLHEKKKNTDVELYYTFDGEKNSSFEKRVHQYLMDQYHFFPFLKEHAVTINSKNNFPHSAGIASSASAFGALAVCLLDVNYLLVNKKMDDNFFKQASQLARLGSGSACRSLYPGFAEWGKNKLIRGSSNNFAIPIVSIHKNFRQMHDTILIVDEQPKKISSSKGHLLMKDHPFAKNRFKQANERTNQLNKVLLSGDYEEFTAIAESESLTLHAMMMTSSDYYLLLKPGTLVALEKITAFRNETKIPICFTLDAGPNVHVLYPGSYKKNVENFLTNNFNDCVKQIIFDNIGSGPQKIKR